MCGVRGCVRCAPLLGQKHTLCGVGRLGNLGRLGNREVKEIREFREGVLGGRSCFSAPEAQLFVAIAFTFREKFIYLHHCPYIQRYKILKI